MQILEKIRNEAGQGAYVRISRRKAGDTDFARVGKMTLEDYSEDRIEEIYGGGEYRVQAYRSDHTFIKHFTFKIDFSIPSKHPRDAEAAAAGGGGGASSESATELARVLLEHQNEGKGDGIGTAALLQLMFKQQESADRRFEAMMKAIGEKKQEESPIMMLLLKSLIEQKPTPMKDMTEAMEMMRRFQRGRSGHDDEEDKEKEDFFDKAGRLFGPIAAEALERMLSNSGQGGGGRPEPKPVQTITPGPRAAAAGAAAASPAAENQPVQEEADMNIFVKAAVARLRKEALAAAAKNDDAEEFANYVSDQIPPAMEDDVIALAKSDDWHKTLFGDDQEAKTHEVWLKKVRDTLLEILTEPAE